MVKAEWTYLQGGQSRGQHDWVHGFPETVKSFITFVILCQILCGKVIKSPNNFLHKTSFSSVCCSFPDYLGQLKKKTTESSPRLGTHFSWSK